MTSCSSFSGEPFNSSQGGFLDASALVAAGYTDAAYERCLSGAAQNYAAWKRTPIDFPFDEFTLLQSHRRDASFSIQLMRRLRVMLGARAVLANEDFDVPLRASTAPIYRELAALSRAAHSRSPAGLSPVELQALRPTVD